MKIIILIFLIIVTSIFSQVVDQKSEKKGDLVLFGGLSIPLDDESDDTGNGFNVGISFAHEIFNNTSVGGLFTADRWSESADIPFVGNIETSLQYTGFLALIRRTTQKVNESYGFIQFGAGVFLGVLTIEIAGDSDIETEKYFGISISGGFVFKKLIICPSYNRVFTRGENDPKWFRLSLGFSL